MKTGNDKIEGGGCAAPPCSPGLTDVETELRKMVPHLRVPAPDAAKVIELAADIVAMCGKSEAEVIRLRNGIDCAVNALTDSVLCGGNDGATNLHFVRKLKSLLSQANKEL